ncbi:unnamed protein product [Tilletia controversa]|uniref:Uncharacterized protein n=3 Tax=Tilletia TaxID=13289 RepID=A0A8X7MZW7_9BASI|nr:hypothetical protein CF336_g372 [Tilletia laevis]KAE8205282.1 hypothetical protein CF328_g589 [Tilletia controversa]KAE8264891.1 hypothetical protein A4X03_0g637 [Tilletia caries]KAE8208568.1 hypothetical protein CF335_g316 [Tilletia laevis]KAE8254861.1 hypothetical protein A4X06_0g704 [Tilletia controversa]
MSSLVPEQKALPRLPTELLQSIFIYAARDVRPKTKYAHHPESSSSSTSPDFQPTASDRPTQRRRRASSTGKNTIASLLSVSKTVQHWVLSELLHSITLTFPSHIVAFGALLKKQPSLGLYVRRLWMSNTGMADPMRNPSSSGMAHNVHRLVALEAYILPKLPHLEDLALSSLTDRTALRPYTHPLWHTGRARTMQDWANLRSLTLANPSGMGAFLQNPNGVPLDDKGDDVHPVFWEKLEILRIALPEELSAYRIAGLARCPRLQVLEFFEPGLDTLLDVDRYTGGVKAAGMGKQRFACIRGRDPDRATIEALFTTLIRPASDEAGIQLHIFTKSPTSYAALRQTWTDLQTIVRDHDQNYVQRFDFPITSDTRFGKAHSRRQLESSSPFCSSTQRRYPTLHVLNLAPEPAGGCVSGNMTRDEGMVPAGEGQDEDDVVPAEEAADWKADLNDVLLAQWARS